MTSVKALLFCCQKLPILTVFSRFNSPQLAEHGIANESCIYAVLATLQGSDPNGIKTRVTAIKGSTSTPDEIAVVRFPAVTPGAQARGQPLVRL